MAAPSIMWGAATSAKSCVRRSTRSPGRGRTASTVKVGSISTFQTPRSRRTGTAKAPRSLPPEIATSPRLRSQVKSTLTIARYGLRTKGATPSRTPRAPRLRKSASVGPSRRLLTRLSDAHMAASSFAPAARTSRSTARMRSVESGTAAAVEPVVKTATSTSDARAKRNATQKPYGLLTGS